MIEVSAAAVTFRDTETGFTVDVEEGKIIDNSLAGPLTARAARSIARLYVRAAEHIEERSYHGFKVGERLKHYGQLYEVVTRPTNPNDVGSAEEWIPVRYVGADGTLGMRNGIRPSEHVTRAS